MHKYLKYGFGLLCILILTGCGNNNEIEKYDGPSIESSTITDYNYKGIQYIPQTITVTNDEIEETLNNYEYSLSYLKRTDKEIVEDEDYVNINFEGKVNGKIIDGQSGEKYDVHIGEGYFEEEFENSLIGKKVGETYNINIVLPESAFYEDIGGKTVNYTITVNYISELITPELTDDLAKENGYANIDDIRNQLTEYLVMDKLTYAISQREQDIINAYLNTCSFNITEEDIKAFNEYTYKEYRNYSSAYDMEYEEFINEYMGMNIEDFENMCTENSTASIKEELGMKAIFDAEGTDINKVYDEYAEKIKTEQGFETIEDLETYYTKEQIEEQIKYKIGKEILLKNAVAVDEEWNKIEDTNLVLYEKYENHEDIDYLQYVEKENTENIESEE